MFKTEDFNDSEFGKDIYSSSGKDIKSKKYEDISSRSARYEDDYEVPLNYKPRTERSAPQQRRYTEIPQQKAPQKRKKRKKHRLLKFVAVLLCLTVIFCSAFYLYAYSIISKIERVELDTSNLGITSTNYSDYKTIALLGLDTREDNKTGRSDANVIVVIDKAHKKVKLVSIARDSYVSIEGHSKDKLTHAYAYGRSQLAVKTLNQNFGTEITDYVTMNFFELAKVIDYMGGVEIEVDQKEFDELNRIIRTTDFGDMPNPRVTTTGVQTLSGTQAVCYARIRKIDSDVERGNRQKEVLSAMFASARKMNPLKLPKLAELILSECETSLSTNDIIGLGIWAILSGPEFEQLSIPNDNVKGRNRIISGVWYYAYDVDAASKEIYDFVVEQNYYSSEQVALRESEEDEE